MTYTVKLKSAASKTYMGVVFTKGIGKTDSEYLAGRFRAKGFAVEAKAEEPAEAEEPEETSRKKARK